MDKVDLGERLQTFRKEKKISGEALGNILGLKKSGIAHIEAGRANLTVPHLKALMEAFPDLNINWLITNHGEMYIGPKDETCWKLLELERKRSETYFTILQENNIRIV